MQRQVLVHLPSGCRRCIDVSSSACARDVRVQLEGIHCGHGVRLTTGRAVLLDASPVPPGSVLTASLALCGGKGGYGSMLRSLGKKHGSENTSDCRDLNGRRLRDVEAAKQAAEWAAGQRERDAAKAAEKKERDSVKQTRKDVQEQEIQEQLLQTSRVDPSKIDASVAAGLQQASAVGKAVKRSADTPLQTGAGAAAAAPRKRCKMLDLSDSDSDVSEDGE